MKNFILILCLATFSQWVYAQNKQITGRVVDTKGEAAIGASILEKGTTNGTITDFDGNFKLTVGPKAVLQISYIGYKTQEIPVANKTKLNITMEEDTEVLDEVVVVGYGAQKKESVVGAISQVSSKELLKSPAANISQAIAGKISGVITSQTSGAPGADDMKIYIRGRASFAGDNQPLILVDGVEREFSQIAPDDIESISTLKDASATAVYGVRGANGVMLITTKRGKEQKPTVSLTANWQIQSPTRQDTYLDSYNSVVLLEEALANDGLPSQYSASDIEMYKRASAGQLSGIDALLYPNVNWYDTVLRNSAPAQRYNVNIQGGTKRMRYFTSAEYYNQQGLFKEFSQDEYGNKSNSSFKRFAFRANLDFLMTKDLTLSVNFGTRFEERRGPNSNESRDGTYSQAFYEMNHTPGWLFPVSYTVGEGEDQKTLYSGSSQYQNNIVARFAKAGFYRSTNTINETNFIVDYKMDWLTKGLAAKGMVSFDYDAYYMRAFNADFATYELNDRNNYNSIDAYTQFNTDTELAYLGNNQTTTYKLYMEFQLNWARKFGKHDITAMALYNQNDYRYQADLAERYQGLVGRATYGYDDRYLAEVNFGYNGSENFMRGRRFGFFPSFSAGWRINQESFMQDASWIDNLKLRASWGQLGNINNVGQYDYFATYVQGGNYNFENTIVSGIREGKPANPGLGWETVTITNVGVDFDILNGLFSFTGEFYDKQTKDILLSYPSPAEVGINSDYKVSQNIGKVSNKGLEFNISHNKSIGDFSYTVGFNLSKNWNKVKDLGANDPMIEDPWIKKVGYAIGTFYGFRSDGLLTQEDIDNGNYITDGITPQAGDIKYVDLDGDGKLTDKDRDYLACDVPDITYGVNLNLRYKGFELSMFGQGVTGTMVRFYQEQAWAFSDNASPREFHLKRWTVDNPDPNAAYPRIYPRTSAHSTFNNKFSDFWLFDSDYFRIKNITFGYNFNKHQIQHLGVYALKLYVSAENPFTIRADHRMEDFDPETPSGRGTDTRGTSSISLGVNLTF